MSVVYSVRKLVLVEIRFFYVFYSKTFFLYICLFFFKIYESLKKFWIALVAVVLCVSNVMSHRTLASLTVSPLNPPSNNSAITAFRVTFESQRHIICTIMPTTTIIYFLLCFDCVAYRKTTKILFNETIIIRNPYGEFLFHEVYLVPFPIRFL